MKRYGSDLEKEYKGILGRINKRLKLLCEMTNYNSFQELSSLDTKDKLKHIKLIEKNYVEKTRQLDMFSRAPLKPDNLKENN